MAWRHAGEFSSTWVAVGAALCTLAACSASDPQTKGSGSTGSSGGGGTSGFGGGASGGFGGSAGSGGSAAGGTGTGGAAAGGSGGGLVIDSGSDADDPDAACTTVSQQASTPSVDIVWVVDRSGSMSDEIDKIETNINTSFVPTITNSTIDWRVLFFTKRGTADLEVCVAPPLAGPSCADNPPSFLHLDCDVQSSNSLTLLRNAWTGGGPACPGQRWDNKVRFDSTKVFVVVTDDAPSFFDVLAQGFDDWATGQAQPAGIFGTKAARKYVFHGIIGMDPTNPAVACTSATNQAVAPGLEYQKLAQWTGGIVRSICEDDWSDIFTTIGEGIVNRLSCDYAVPQPPAGQTIDPNEVNVAFTPGGSTTPVDVLQDNNFACDAGANGWQWNANKTRILLCGQACADATADTAAKLDIVFGCATKIAPPPE